MVHSHHWNTSVDTLKMKDIFLGEGVHEDNFVDDLLYCFRLKTKITAGPFTEWLLTMEKGAFLFYMDHTISFWLKCELKTLNVT